MLRMQIKIASKAISTRHSGLIFFMLVERSPMQPNA